MSSQVLTTDVCVTGGGPAGLMLAVTLARRGVHVVVLEKHADFLRDFRGDTVHPSTLDLLDQLGLGPELDRLPHRDVTRMVVTFADGAFPIADFSRLPVAHPYLRFMPQWHLLNLLAEAGEKHPAFTVLRSHEVTDVIRDRGIVTGVRASDQPVASTYAPTSRSAADGRSSVTRDRLDLPLRSKVQSRRRFPTVATQALQVAIQRLFLGPVLAADRPITAPAPLKLVRRFPALQRIPARVIGIGVRPERLDDRCE
jgi:2-polyprenyl-6-methoxyphenol hydroxylase-like FAD-dependent oxidoreductase